MLEQSFQLILGNNYVIFSMTLQVRIFNKDTTSDTPNQNCSCCLINKVLFQPQTLSTAKRGELCTSLALD